MSTIQDIMAELQAGEHAKAQIPELSRRIALLEGELSRAQQHNQGLELRAKERDDTISMLTQKTAKLTEERDDASFRVLEAEDKLSTFAKAVGNAWGGIGNALNAVNPPKVEPQPAVAEVKAEPVPMNPQHPGDKGYEVPLAGPSETTGSGQATTGQSEGGPIARTEQSAGTGVAASGQGHAAGPAAALEAPSGSHNTGVSGPDPWKPAVEMPEVKAEEPAKPEPYEAPPWYPSKPF